jgi:hypothetical protein
VNKKHSAAHKHKGASKTRASVPVPAPGTGKAIDPATLERFIDEMVTQQAFDRAMLQNLFRQVRQLPAVIDAMTPPERWEWGGPRWRDHVVTTDAVAITGVDVQADAPVTMAARWAEVLGRQASPDRDHIAMPLDHDSLIRFTPTRDGRGDGVGAFEVAVRDIEAVRRRAQARGCIDAQGHLVLCGTRVQLRQA